MVGEHTILGIYILVYSGPSELASSRHPAISEGNVAYGYILEGYYIKYHHVSNIK